MPSYKDTYKSESKYLKVDDLQKKRVALTIDDVVNETIGEQEKLVLSFRETDKKFVLNITNARMLEMLTDSDDIIDWRGLKIVLRPDVTTFNGKPTPCIRIDSELPAQPAQQKELVPAGLGEDLGGEIPF